MAEMSSQMHDGFYCFLGVDVNKGDDCSRATSALLVYVGINFLYNVFQLLVTKHGSATTMVISSALALPVTNLLFSSELLLGAEAEPLSLYDVAGLVVVLAGFLVYSFSGDKHMPAQGAGGSMVYVRERSSSDPPLATPSFSEFSRRLRQRRARRRRRAREEGGYEGLTVWEGDEEEGEEDYDSEDDAPLRLKTTHVISTPVYRKNSRVAGLLRGGRGGEKSEGLFIASPSSSRPSYASINGPEDEEEGIPIPRSEEEDDDEEHHPSTFVASL